MIQFYSKKREVFKNNRDHRSITVTPLDKEKILDAIHKEHGVLLDSKDPIFAIMTANDIILTQHTNALEASLLQQKNEIESITQEYLKEAKVLAEQKISTATQAAQRKVLSTIEATSSKSTSLADNKIPLLFALVTGGILGYTLALLVL